MKYSITILAAAIATSLSAFVPTIATAEEVDAATSKATFDRMCAGCHGFRGDGGEGHRGGFSPHIGTLAQKAYMESVPDEYLFLIIKKGGAYMGKISTMPAWEHKFTDDEINGLVKHIRTFLQ